MAASSSKPRLLFVLHDYGSLTGVELHAHTLAAGLQQRYEIALAYPRGNEVRLLRVQGGETAYPGARLPWPATPALHPALERAFARILADFRPDIIHIQHFLNWHLGIIDQAVESGAPVVLSFHDYYAITPQLTMQGADDVEQSFTSAYCRTAFGSDITPYLEERRRLLQSSLARVHARVAVSPFLQRQLTQVFAETFQVIENGIPALSRVPVRAQAPGVRFGFVGNLVPAKGWRLLFDTFPEVRRRHPSAELHFHGWPEGQAASGNGITFHGTYQPHELATICAAIDVAVIPSLFPQPYSLVLSEMWCAGLPVVVAAIGALQERVADGVTGKLFEPGNANSLADALCWFAEHDDWRHWQLPSPRLSPEMVQDYDQLYQQVLKSRRTETDVIAGPGLQADLLIVQICEFLDVGDGVYRFHGPSRALSRLPGIVVIDCDLNHHLLPLLAETADVLILAGFDWDMFPLLERRRTLGRITVFEANDYYYDVHPWNPLSTKWLDRSIQDSFQHGLTLADAVQTSTPELARRWRQRTTRAVAAFPNHLEEVPPLPPLQERPLTIGWGGSPGHFADWYHIAPLLEQWLLAHPQVHLAVMTHEFARSFIRLPAERYHFTTFGSLAEYFRFLRGLDIGLAPLLPSDYNQCRSDVKFVEYAAHGVAGIYADLQPYRDNVTPGQTGLIYCTDAEFLQALDELAENAVLRRRIREQAYAEISQRRRLADHVGERLTFYRSLLPERMRKQILPAEIMAAAACDGRYLQLRRRQAEKTLLAALEAPASKESVQSLSRLVEEKPDYRRALQLLGQQLNDLGNGNLALSYLERARALDPHSARTLYEIARAQYRRDEVAQARTTLETAVAINPYFPPAWNYFLRLLAVTRAEDASHWAAEAHRHNPANFALALVGVKLYSPDQAVTVLQQLVEDYAPSFLPEELPQAAAAFSETIGQVAGPRLGDASVLPLLRTANAVFPHSARLAYLLGHALYLAGESTESRAHLIRAAELRRAARTYQAEYPTEDGSIHFGQFAEQIEAMVRKAESDLER